MKEYIYSEDSRPCAGWDGLVVFVEGGEVRASMDGNGSRLCSYVSSGRLAAAEGIRLVTGGHYYAELAALVSPLIPA